MFEQYQNQLTELRRLLSKSPLTRVGTLVGWRTPSGHNYGVVLGVEGKDLICLSTFHRKLKSDGAITYYEDADLTQRLGDVRIVPSIMTAIQRVPLRKAFKRGALTGKAARPYLDASVRLNLEHTDMRNESLELLNDRLTQLRLQLEAGVPEPEALTENVFRWIKQKYGSAKALAHRAFVKMVRKDPAAHRRKMKSDKKYHRTHKWHDRVMQKTARKGFKRVGR